MTTNGSSSYEDSEMAEHNGENVVTMMDVLQEQQDFEEDANAVLGASDEKNCTYSKGYVKRQALYACLTCCADVKDNPEKRAGVCLACSLACHENHELVELYTKRNFRCDCGNSKFDSNPCQFTPDKSEVNEENNYNQNFSGLYCVCQRPYPDPEASVEEEMIQCIVCEDWLHTTHLEATVPSSDLYSEMICKSCMNRNDFLHNYSMYAVNTEDVDVNITEITDCQSILDDSILDNEATEKSVSEIKNEISNIEPKIEEESININNPITETKETNIENEAKEKENVETIEQTVDTSTNNTTSNIAVSSEIPDSTNIQANELDQTADNINSSTVETVTTNSENVESNTKVASTANSDDTENSAQTAITTSSENTENNTETPKEQNRDEKEIDQSNGNVTNDKITESVATNDSTMIENTEISKESIVDNSDAMNEEPTEKAQEEIDNEKNTAEADTTSTTEQNTVDGNKTENDDEMKSDGIDNGENNDIDMTEHVNDHKRKLSTEEEPQEHIVKKTKLNSDCKKPNRKKIYNGATFWRSTFRAKLCICSECLSMYKDLSVLFLTDVEDTVTAYEALGKERINGNPVSQYEKGLEALSSLDRIQQINALTEYNKMRDKLLDFLKSFKERKEIVKEEDIKAFFAGMKPKREPDGVYFCR